MDWGSDEGLQFRLDMLAHSYSWEVYNEASQDTMRSLGVKHVVWVSEWDERCCNYCFTQDGRVYRLGMFLPTLPNHVFCRCFWDPAED